MTAPRRYTAEERNAVAGALDRAAARIQLHCNVEGLTTAAAMLRQAAAEGQGNNPLCVCGHFYSDHLDAGDMQPVGCNVCGCVCYVVAPTATPTEPTPPPVKEAKWRMP